MNSFVELWEGGPKFMQSEHFRLGTDSVLLSDFVNIGKRSRGIDLGTGSGILPLLLSQKSERLSMTGLEVDSDAVAVAEQNFAENSLSERCRAVCGDIRDCRGLFSSGEFDLVVSNPPYFPEGSGCSSPDPRKAAAREERSCTLADIVSAAAYLCRTGGTFSLVHRAERLADVICALREGGFEPKRLRLVSHSAESEPALLLIEARRGGASGMKLMPALILRNRDGTETDEVLGIYHRR